MSEAFMKIDLHGLTQEEAIPVFDKSRVCNDRGR